MDRCSHQEEIRKWDNNLSCVTIFFCRLFMQFSLASDYLSCVSMAYNYYEIEKCKVGNTDDGVDERYQLRLLRYALISYIKPAWRARHLPELACASLSGFLGITFCGTRNQDFSGPTTKILVSLTINPITTTTTTTLLIINLYILIRQL